MNRKKYERLFKIFSKKRLAFLIHSEERALQDFCERGISLPPEQISRLDFLTETCDCLAGSYNNCGIDNWFFRRRAQLGMQSPYLCFLAPWNPKDELAQKVMTLAKVLTGPMNAT